MNKSSKEEIRKLIEDECSFRVASLGRDIMEKIGKNPILVFTQSTGDGRTDYISMRIKDAIQVIKDYLEIDFKRQSSPEYIAEKRSKK